MVFVEFINDVPRDSKPEALEKIALSIIDIAGEVVAADAIAATQSSPNVFISGLSVVFNSVIWGKDLTDQTSMVRTD